MEPSTDFVSLFATEAGELFYFVAIFIIYQAALLMGFDQQRRSDAEIAASRYVNALAIALVAWMALMGGAILSVVSDELGSNIMPPLESTVNVMIVIALSLGLLLDDRAGTVRTELLISMFLVGLLCVGFVATLGIWDPDRAFYDQVISLSWTFVAILIIASAAALLLSYYNQVADVPLKLLFYVLLAAGHVYTLVELLSDNLDGDVSGAVRWSFLLSGLLLLVIIYRMVIDQMTSAVEEVVTYAETISKPLKAISVSAGPGEAVVADVSPELGQNITAGTAGTSGIGGRNEALELLKALGIMLDKDDTNTLPYQTVQAVAEMLKADIVALISYDKSDWADLVVAYDFGRKQPLAGMSINLEEQPTLLEALQTKKQILLTQEDDTHAHELVDLYTRFDMNIQGLTYIQPMSRLGQVIGALIVGFPYQRRVLRSNETRLLESIGPIAARLMVISRTARIERVQAEERAIFQLVEGYEGNGEDEELAGTTLLAMRKEMQASLDMAEREINELNTHIQNLEAELSKERERLHDVIGEDEDDDLYSITQRIEIISTERKQLQEERRNLANALREAQSTLIGVTSHDDLQTYEAMVNQMQEEIRELREQRNRLETQLHDLRLQQPSSSAAQNLLQQMTEDHSYLSAERQQLQTQLDDTQSQLAAIQPVPEPDFAQRLARLTEEREKYKGIAQKAVQQRNMLLKERKNLENAIKQEKERSERIAALESEVVHLTEDREAIAHQRDEVENRLMQLDKETEYARTQHNVLQAERDQALEILARANQSREVLAVERNEAIAERDLLFAELEKYKHEFETIKARVEGDRDRLKTLGDAGNQPLQRMIDEMTQERVNLENKLATVTHELATLQQELALYRGAQPTARPSLPIDVDVIVSLAQELRSPLSVIMGYTDTVLSESVGILGALQRKLLTRVKANVDRLAYLVEELVQISVLDAGELELNPKRVNLLDITDDAISASRYKFSEKGIVIDMEVQNDAVWLEADEEALRQIVNHLIQNAYLVSPTDGTVTVSITEDTDITVPGTIPEQFENAVLVAVRDRGGGIKPEDEGRVFTRLYRAENPLIEGLGDTGVGMSITKALIEAHGGRVWLESNVGEGNTFKFVIPTKQPVLQATGEDVGANTTA